MKLTYAEQLLIKRVRESYADLNCADDLSSINDAIMDCAKHMKKREKQIEKLKTVTIPQMEALGVKLNPIVDGFDTYNGNDNVSFRYPPSGGSGSPRQGVSALPLERLFNLKFDEEPVMSNHLGLLDDMLKGLPNSGSEIGEEVDKWQKGAKVPSGIASDIGQILLELNRKGSINVEAQEGADGPYHYLSVTHETGVFSMAFWCQDGEVGFNSSVYLCENGCYSAIDRLGDRLGVKETLRRFHSFVAAATILNGDSYINDKYADK